MSDMLKGLAPVEAALRSVMARDPRGRPDLTVRQTVILLRCYRTVEKQTIRDLAAYMGVNKSVVSRGLDTLEERDLVKRECDQADRRSVLVHRTFRGQAMMRTMNNEARAA